MAAECVLGEDFGQQVLGVWCLSDCLSSFLGWGFVATSCALQGCHGDRASRTGNGDSLSRIQGLLLLWVPNVGDRSFKCLIFGEWFGFVLRGVCFVADGWVFFSRACVCV